MAEGEKILIMCEQSKWLKVGICDLLLVKLQ